MVDSSLTGISADDNDRRHSKFVMKNAFLANQHDNAELDRVRIASPL
jgi:hypothetical protein